MGSFIEDQSKERLYRSIDGGVNWSEIPISWTNFVLNSINKIVFNPNNPNNIVVLEENEIVVTHDAFQTWQTTVFPEDPYSYYFGLQASFNPFNTNELLITNDFYPLRSTDGGQTVSVIQNPYFSSTSAAMLFEGVNSHLYYGVQNGYIHKNLKADSESKNLIEPINYASITNPSFFAIDALREGRFYTVSSGFFGNELYVSDDHGLTNNLIYTSFNTIGNPLPHPDSDKVSFLMGETDPITGEPLDRIVELDFSNPNNVTEREVQLPFQEIVSDIFVDPADPNKRIMALGSDVFQSLNSGSTWQETSTGLEALTFGVDVVFDIAQNPLLPSQFGIATTQGVFLSNDNALTWSQVSTDFTTKITFSDKVNGHLVATTRNTQFSNFQIHFSSNEGQNWQTVASQNTQFIDTSRDPAISFTNNGAKLYIGTYDLGLVSYSINLSPLSNEEIESPASWITFYPNPAKDFLNLKSQGEPIDNVSIYTLNGTKVINETIAQQKDAYINIANLSKGLYLVKIKFKTEKQSTIKLIKN